VPRETRAVCFLTDAPTQTPVFQRDDLSPGHIIMGPAIIEQVDSTSIVYPGDRMMVDDVSNLIIGVHA
jgi:N-methylhydantoinase A